MYTNNLMNETVIQVVFEYKIYLFLKPGYNSSQLLYCKFIIKFLKFNLLTISFYFVYVQ